MEAGDAAQQDPVQQLQADLNIHVAVGTGLINGYHTGGVGGKWHYVIEGPAMRQVCCAACGRSPHPAAACRCNQHCLGAAQALFADSEAGAGEVVLSKESRALLKE
eukprot:COSAG02_NODE_11070_length_1801_cov_1.091657_4_plen_106_part_00